MIFLISGQDVGVIRIISNLYIAIINKVFIVYLQSSKTKANIAINYLYSKFKQVKTF